jgi:hypothetical protein
LGKGERDAGNDLKVTELYPGRLGSSLNWFCADTKGALQISPGRTTVKQVRHGWQ